MKIHETSKSYIWTHVIYILLLLICSFTIAGCMIDLKLKCPNLFLFMQCNGLPDNSPVCANNMMLEESITIGIPLISSFILFILLCLLLYRRIVYSYFVNRYPLIILYISFTFIFFSMAISFSGYFRKARPCKDDNDFNTKFCEKSTLKNNNGVLMNADNLKDEYTTFNTNLIVIQIVLTISILLCIFYIIHLSYKFTSSVKCKNLFDLKCDGIDYDT